MKKLIAILSAAALLAASAFSLDAQTLRKNKEFSPFENVEVCKAFVVTFENSDSYEADWEINAELAEYVDIYVRQNTLKVDLNKEGAKLLKKNYRGQNLPVMKITISMPDITNLTLTENSSIDVESEPMHSKNFTFTAKDKAKVTEFSMNVDGNAAINLSKDADVTLKMMAKKIKISADNSAVMALTHSSDEISVVQGGSSSIGLAGDVDKIEIETRNSSKLNIQGNGYQLSCNSKGVSEIEAEKFEVKKASVVLNSAIAWINATDELEMELSNSSEVIFCGNPKMKIVDVKKSSITRIENAEKKK